MEHQWQNGSLCGACGLERYAEGRLLIALLPVCLLVLQRFVPVISFPFMFSRVIFLSVLCHILSFSYYFFFISLIFSGVFSFNLSIRSV